MSPNGGDSGKFDHDAHDHNEDRNQTDRRDAERGIQTREQRSNISRYARGITAAVAQAGDKVKDLRNGKAGECDRHGALHQIKDLAAHDRGGEICRIGERRDDLTEVRAGDDAACDDRGRDAEGDADAHKRESHRTDRAPCADGERDDAAGECSGDKEELRRDDLEPIVNKCGDSAGGDPGADKHADKQQDYHGFKRLLNAGEHTVEDLLPGEAEVKREERGNRAAEDQRDLRFRAADHHADENQDCCARKTDKPVIKFDFFFANKVLFFVEFIFSLFICSDL